MWMRVQETETATIVGICDKEHIGKVYKEGEFVLDLKTYAGFYKGRLVGEEEAASALKEATSINLVGKRATSLGLKLGLVGKKEIRKVCGVPHAQAYRI